MLPYSYHRHPNPHIYFPQLLPPEVYERITFPKIAVRGKGRSGRDLFMGEPGFAEAAGSVGFKELYDLFTSAAFVHWVLSIFEGDMIRLHCRAKAKDAKLVPYLETREALDLAPDVLDKNADPSEVFNRFDFAIGDLNYTEYAHLDSVRRVIGGVLYFSDAETDKIEGGEFTLYKDLLFTDDRRPHWPYPWKKIPIKGNTGVLFLNSNRGFHGPSQIRSIQGTRRWVYYSISSHNRVWEPRKQDIVRSVATRATVRLLHLLGYPGIAREPQSKIEANLLEDDKDKRLPGA